MIQACGLMQALVGGWRVGYRVEEGYEVERWVGVGYRIAGKQGPMGKRRAEQYDGF